MELNRDDMRFAQKTLRWAAIGIPPSEAVARQAIGMLDGHKESLPTVVRSLEQLRAGILPSQENCLTSERQLIDYYADVEAQADKQGQRMGMVN